MTPSFDTILQGTLHDCLGACGATMPGHELAPIQERVASATPGKWADAIVVSVSTGGWVEVALVASNDSVVLWNHADLSGSLTVGDAVALHSVYDVLAVGDVKHNVLRAQF